MKTTLTFQSGFRASNLVLCELPETGLAGQESFSAFALQVHRALNLAGLTFETRRSPDFSGTCAVAVQDDDLVLLVDDVPVSGASQISARIEELAPGSLVPADPRVRAEAWLWQDWANDSLSVFATAARFAGERNWSAVREALFGTAPWFVRTFVAPRVRQRALDAMGGRSGLRGGEAVVLDGFRRALDRLEARAPETGFWLGEAPSVADLAIFAQLHVLRTERTPAYARELKLRPTLTDWLDRVDAATVRNGMNFPDSDVSQWLPTRGVRASSRAFERDVLIVAARASSLESFDMAFCG